ncbi:MAG: hypothetical protein Q9207_005567 [Kuettlingeria erythrocarpa]
MDSSNPNAEQSRKTKEKSKSDKHTQGSSMGAASASAPSTKGRKKRSLKALDENNGGSENGEATASRSKRAKTVKDSAKVDFEDQFFELPGTRRVTINSYKGNTLVHIREYYVDENGEKKPAKKYSGLMTLLPEIEAALVARGESVARPQYTDAQPAAEAAEQAAAEPIDNGDQGDDDPEPEIKTEKKAKQKENFEATSEEDE